MLEMKIRSKYFKTLIPPTNFHVYNTGTVSYIDNAVLASQNVVLLNEHLYSLISIYPFAPCP